MTVRIGTDVGGTNTDAVLMDGSRVVSSTKTPTTPDVNVGITAALRQLVAQSELDVENGFKAALAEMGEPRAPWRVAPACTTASTPAPLRNGGITSEAAGKEFRYDGFRGDSSTTRKSRV